MPDSASKSKKFHTIWRGYKPGMTFKCPLPQQPRPNLKEVSELKTPNLRGVRLYSESNSLRKSVGANAQVERLPSHLIFQCLINAKPAAVPRNRHPTFHACRQVTNE